VTPRIYVLLPVHNRREITRTLVECLVAQTYDNYELVLIDDGSTDGTAEMVKQLVPSATVLRGTGKWWWAGCLQHGLDVLASRRVNDDSLVLFMNDDVTFGPDFLQNAVDVMRGKEGTLMVARTLAPDETGTVETGVVADLRRLSFRVADSAGAINCLPTRALFAYWSDVRTIGGFHPRLLPHYLSDYEYTIRAHKKGLRCETSPRLVIVSNEEATGYRTINERSFPRFLQKYFSKKAAANPIYWSSFVLLAVSPFWILPNLARVWRSALRDIGRALTRSLSHNPGTQASPKTG
jgi:GT2 family glycosyltransferase